MSPSHPRRRLAPQERRAQILDVTTELLSSRPLDEVTMELVAERAEVSRALIYHHFESRTALFRAVVEWVSRALREAMRQRDGLADAVAAYLDFVESHAPGFRALYLGGLSADPAIAEILDASRQEYIDITLQLIGLTEADEATRLTIRAWHSYFIECCVQFAADPKVSRSTAEAAIMNSLPLFTGLLSRS